MDVTVHKKWRVIATIVTILGGVILAALLTYSIVVESAKLDQYFNKISKNDLYLEIGSIFASKDQADSFAFDDTLSYRLYTDDYGSESVYTNSSALYDLYQRVDYVHRYLSFDIPLLDPKNVEVYSNAATLMSELKSFLINNRDKETFQKNITDFYALISQIGPLKEIWEQEEQKEFTDNVAFLQSVFSRFNEE